MTHSYHQLVEAWQRHRQESSSNGDGVLSPAAPVAPSWNKSFCSKQQISRCAATGMPHRRKHVVACLQTCYLLSLPLAVQQSDASQMRLDCLRTGCAAWRPDCWRICLQKQTNVHNLIPCPKLASDSCMLHRVRTLRQDHGHGLSKAEAPELCSAGTKPSIVMQHGVHSCSRYLTGMCSVKLFSFIALLLFGTSGMHAITYVTCSHLQTLLLLPT